MTGQQSSNTEQLISSSGIDPTGALNVRWLGRTNYREALKLQTSLFENGVGTNWLLLQEHNPVYTMGVRAKAEHLLVDREALEASKVDVVPVNRGGDITFHGPGQLVGYPILDLPGKAGLTDTASYIERIEQMLIDVLVGFGLENVGRLKNYPGVWLDVDTSNARKIAAVGVRLSRGRSMHGFALNVAPDMDFFKKIVPCGISEFGVTSLRDEGVDATMRDVVDAVVERCAQLSTSELPVVRHDVVWRNATSDLSAFSRGEGPGKLVPDAIRENRFATIDSAGSRQAAKTSQPVRLLGRLAQAGVDSTNSVPLDAQKPEWMQVKAKLSGEYFDLKKTVADAGLVTVCEEAGCPNIFECWKSGTATFMINGERCTRACGFCLVDTRKPQPLDPTEPSRVAETVRRMGLEHAVITTVARDDLADGGSGAFAQTIAAIREAQPTCAVEVLISDCKGDEASLATIFDARPDVMNHNIETVVRLQRAVRPSASYTRSLGVLSYAKSRGLITKSGLMVGLGESVDEVLATLVDLNGIGVDIVTIGQYLRPTSNHLPVQKWWTPEEFDSFKRYGESIGIAHVESSPLTRSSFHAKDATDAVATRLNLGSASRPLHA